MERGVGGLAFDIFEALFRGFFSNHNILAIFFRTQYQNLNILANFQAILSLPSVATDTRKLF